MVNVTAAKEVRYAGRTYRPGESFDATARDANLLERVGKVTPAAAAVPSPVDLPPAPEVNPDAELADLREQYARQFNKRPYMGWSPAQLRERMALDAPSTYQRRDLRAE